MIRSATIALVALCACVAPAAAANWTVSHAGHMLLTPPGGVTVQEMSGVTYMGPVGDAHRFLAAEQTKGEMVRFDVTFNSAGAISGIANVTAVFVNSLADFEGIAYTNAARNSVFLSDEAPAGPGVREVNLATGTGFQTVSIPTVFTANERTNRGFESLARSLDATVMWTANEEALTVDGGVATPSAGTTVRLLKFNVAGNAVSAGAQFAYNVEPMHGPPALGNGQSGLSDLAVMPDGTLLSLERSLGNATPPYRSRIFEIDFAAATDVSVGPTAGGLIGQIFTPVSKQVLWSGAADGASGQNLEGLALGPRLANGDWVLLGVVDDDPDDLDTLSANTVVAFTAKPNVSADFDADGDVDGRDFLAWQRGIGATVGAKHAEGDADRDGDVDAADLNAWKLAQAGPALATPEPAATVLLAPGLFWLAASGARRMRRG